MTTTRHINERRLTERGIVIEMIDRPVRTIAHHQIDLDVMREIRADLTWSFRDILNGLDPDTRRRVEARAYRETAPYCALMRSARSWSCS